MKAIATRQLAELTLPSSGDEDGAPERSPVFVDGSAESNLDERAWSSPLLYLAPSSPTALAEIAGNLGTKAPPATSGSQGSTRAVALPGTPPGVEAPSARGRSGTSVRM